MGGTINPAFTIGDAPKRPPQQFTIGDAPPAPTPPESQNFFQRNWESNTAPQDTGHPISDFAHNVGGRAAQAFAAPVTHPLETLKGLGKIMAAGPGNQWQNAAEMAQGYIQSAHPYENMLGDALGGAAQGGVIGAGIAGARGMFSPYESPALPPGTRAYQRFAQTIGPTGQAEAMSALPGLTEDVMARHSDIANFARESNIPLKTPEEYGLAAKGHKELLNSRFYGQLQEPFSQDRIHVSPEVAAYKTPGAVQPLGPYPTVAELSEALKAANQIAGKGYQGGANAFNQTQVMAAENTARQIRQTLNEHLSAKSNLSPEEVSTFRQRGGQTGNIAENAAARAQANRMAQGKSPLEAESVKGFLLRSGQSLFGGPEAMANRGFRRALGQLPEGTPTPLPDVQTGEPGGTIPPPTFSPKATTAGPEPLSPPPIRAARQFNPRTGKYE